MKRILFVYVILCSYSLHAQFREKVLKLPEELNEISGLSVINDSLLVTHNDSGDSPKIYFISPEGTILHTAYLKNAKNRDWEDIAIDDKGFLYIADVGNNSNARKNLCVYKVNVQEALKNDSVLEEIITFTYSDQVCFPPAKENFEFDCEAIFWQKDSLFLVTKSSAKPWKGYAMIYGLSTLSGEQSAMLVDSVLIGKRGWRKDAVTAADFFENKLYLLTYNRMIVYSSENGTFTKKYSRKFNRYNQKEALAVMSENRMFVGTEKHKLLNGPYLYSISKK